MKCIIGVLILGSMGCSPPVASNHYTVVIDPALADNYVVAIYAAIDSWQIALDDKLQIEYSSTGVCTGNDREVCIHASTHAALDTMGCKTNDVGCTNWNDWSDRSDMYLPVDVLATANATFLQLVVAHEFGHSMHLMHEVGTIEHPAVMCSNSACVHTNVPVCQDVAQYWSIHSNEDTWGFGGPKITGCSGFATFTLSGN